MSKGDGTGGRMSREVGSSPAGRLWACHNETRSLFLGCPSMPRRKPSRPPGGGLLASIIPTLRAATRRSSRAPPGRWRRSTPLTRSCAIPRRGGCTERQAHTTPATGGMRRGRSADTRGHIRTQRDRVGAPDLAQHDRLRRGSTRVRYCGLAIRRFGLWTGAHFRGCRRVPGPWLVTSRPERRIPQDRCVAIAGRSWTAICRH